VKAEMIEPDDARPLLTIAIPTFNRASFLKELLSVLFDQLIDEPRVEFIISDNASPDETPAVVEEYRRRGLTIRSIRNETNIGSDANFLQCFEHARGKYFWLFSDDDIIVGGGVAKILRLLAMDDYALAFICPFEFRRDYLAEKTTDKLGRIAQILPGGMQIVRKAGTMITFISALIVNKDYYSTINHPDLQEFIGTNLMLLGWVCPILAESKKNLIVWERLVAGRGDNSGGWSAGQVFGINLQRVANTAFGNRRDMAAELTNRTLRSWFPETIMGTRRGTGKPLLKENLREVMEPAYSTNWRYWIYVYPLIVLPLGMARAWYSIIKLTNRLSRSVSLLMEYIFLQRDFLKES
jgi:glycosyltransferase involved in cell wall biosynthesis